MEATPNLVKVLAKLYRREGSISRLVRDLRLENIITYHARAIDTWSELFEGIVDMGKVVDLFDYVENDYPDNELWQKARMRYEESQRQEQPVAEVSPSVRLDARRPLLGIVTLPANWGSVATRLRKAIRELEKALRRSIHDIERSDPMVSHRLHVLAERITDARAALDAITSQPKYSDGMPHYNELRLRQVAAAEQTGIAGHLGQIRSIRLKVANGDLSREQLEEFHSTVSELIQRLWEVYQSIRQLLRGRRERNAGQG